MIPGAPVRALSDRVVRQRVVVEHEPDAGALRRGGDAGADLERFEQAIDRSHRRVRAHRLDAEDVRHPCGQVHVQLGEDVRAEQPPVRGGEGGDAQELGDPAAHRGVDADVVNLVAPDQPDEVVDARAVLAHGEGHVDGTPERPQQVDVARRERVLDPQ